MSGAPIHIAQDVLPVHGGEARAAAAEAPIGDATATAPSRFADLLNDARSSASTPAPPSQSRPAGPPKAHRAEAPPATTTSAKAERDLSTKRVAASGAKFADTIGVVGLGSAPRLATAAEKVAEPSKSAENAPAPTGQTKTDHGETAKAANNNDVPHSDAPTIPASSTLAASGATTPAIATVALVGAATTAAATSPAPAASSEKSAQHLAVAGTSGRAPTTAAPASIAASAAAARASAAASNQGQLPTPNPTASEMRVTSTRPSSAPASAPVVSDASASPMSRGELDTTATTAAAAHDADQQPASVTPAAVATTVSPVVSGQPVTPTAPTAASSTHATQAVALPGVASQLVSVLSPLRVTTTGTQSLTIALYPEGLGTVRATVSLDENNQLVVRLAATSETGESAIRAALPDLERGLTDDGTHQPLVLLQPSGGATANAGSGAGGAATNGSGGGQSSGQSAHAGGPPQGRNSATAAPKGPETAAAPARPTNSSDSTVLDLRL